MKKKLSVMLVVMSVVMAVAIPFSASASPSAPIVPLTHGAGTDI